MRVVIDGSMSAGKSTCIHALAMLPGVICRAEPVDEWQDLLQKMYEAPSRWAMTFNAKVLLHFKAAMEQDPLRDAVIVYERSPWACRHVFCKLQQQLGYMDDAEMVVLDEVYKRTYWEPDVMIYLRSSPGVAYDRLRRRARPCEEAVDRAYMNHLHEAYEDMVAKMSIECPGTRVIVVDADQGPDVVAARVKEVIDAALRAVLDKGRGPAVQATTAPAPASACDGGCRSAAGGVRATTGTA